MRAQRAEHHGAGNGEPLFGRPQRLFAATRADHQKVFGIDPELRQPCWVGRALFSEGRLFAGPDQPCAAAPVRRKPKRHPQGGGLLAGPGRADFVQRRRRHALPHGVEIGLLRARRRGDWTRTHVLYMF